MLLFFLCPNLKCSLISPYWLWGKTFGIQSIINTSSMWSWPATTDLGEVNNLKYVLYLVGRIFRRCWFGSKLLLLMSFCINVYEPFADFTKDRSYSNWILKKKWYLIKLIKKHYWICTSRLQNICRTAFRLVNIQLYWVSPRYGADSSSMTIVVDGNRRFVPLENRFRKLLKKPCMDEQNQLIFKKLWLESPLHETH